MRDGLPSEQSMLACKRRKLRLDDRQHVKLKMEKHKGVYYNQSWLIESFFLPTCNLTYLSHMAIQHYTHPESQPFPAEPDGVPGFNLIRPTGSNLQTLLEVCIA